MIIENLNPETVTYTVIPIQGKKEHTFNFGVVPQGTPLNFKALIKNATHDYIKAGCPACTSATATQVENDVEIEIKMKINNGYFNKTVIEKLKNGTQIVFKIQGTVK